MRHKYSTEVYAYFRELASKLAKDPVKCMEVEKSIQNALDLSKPVKNKTWRYRGARDLLYIFMCRYAHNMSYDHICLYLVPPTGPKTVNYYCNFVESYFLERM